MPNYRRARIPGATYFFTVATAQRRSLLATAEAVAALRQSVVEVRRQLPFSIDAWVVLPDHMHAIWTLPASDFDFLHALGQNQGWVYPVLQQGTHVRTRTQRRPLAAPLLGAPGS